MAMGEVESDDMQRWPTRRYYRYLNTIGAAWSPAVGTIDRLSLWIIQIPRRLTIDRLFWVSGDIGAGGNWRMGIYSDNGVYQPYNQPLLAETAAIAAAAFLRNEGAIADLQLSPGLYWLAWIVSTAVIETWRVGPTDIVAAGVTPYSHYLNWAFGALPNPYPAASTNTGSTVPYMGVRVKSIP